MPFVKAKLQGGSQKPTAIFLRPTQTNSSEGAALAVAQQWHKGSGFWVAGHYTVDERKRYRCADDDVVVGSGADKNAIRIAMCADPVSNTTFWDENRHRLVLRKTAELVAELTLVHGIYVDYIDDDDLTRWRKRRSRRRGGIYVTEPSGFPFEAFMREVDAKRALKKHI